MVTEWPKKETLRLIEAYKKRPILWDLNHRLHSRKRKRDDAWIELSAELNKSPKECKRKWDSVLATFRREEQKMMKNKRIKMKRIRSEEEEDEGYTPSWYAFEPLQFLLEEKKKPKDSLNNKIKMKNNPNTKADSQSQSGMTEAEMDNEDSETEAVCSSETEEERNEEGRDKEETVSGGTNNKRKGKKGKAMSKMKRKNEEDGNLDTSFSVLNSSVASEIDDDSQVFGNLVAVKLRRYDNVTRSSIQNAVLGSFLDADKGLL